MKLLFMVDGDGIVQVLKLGNRGDEAGNGDYITLASLMVAVIIFCISLLNLFIAVHGRAYSEAHMHATNLFLQERASICVHCMVQLRLPMCCGHKRKWWKLGYFVLAFLAFGGWVLCILIEDCPAIIPAVLLSLAFYLPDPQSPRLFQCFPVISSYMICLRLHRDFGFRGPIPGSPNPNGRAGL